MAAFSLASAYNPGVVSREKSSATPNEVVCPLHWPGRAGSQSAFRFFLSQIDQKMGLFEGRTLSRITLVYQSSIGLRFPNGRG